MVIVGDQIDTTGGSIAEPLTRLAGQKKCR